MNLFELKFAWKHTYTVPAAQGFMGSNVTKNTAVLVPVVALLQLFSSVARNYCEDTAYAWMTVH